MANGPSLWETFVHAAMHSPLGGGGLARAYYRSRGYSNDQINHAISDADTDYDKKSANSPLKEFKGRHGKIEEYLQHKFGDNFVKKLDKFSPENVVRQAPTLLASILGHVDPTFAIAPGATALERIPAQAIVQAGSSVARQGVDVGTGMRQKISPKEVLQDMAAGAAFQGSAEVLGAAARGLRGTPKAFRDSDVHADEAPLAPDGLPGNGSVRPMDPKEIARIMNDPEAAGLHGINDNVPNRRTNGRDLPTTITDDDLQALPPANREYVNQQLTQEPPVVIPDEHLTPAEAQEMDASVPTVPVDNTGYEKFTPNSEPPAPANDPHEAEIVPIAPKPNVDETVSAFADKHGVGADPEVMLHGSPNPDIQEFDPYGKGNYGLFGTGTYLTDHPSVSMGYSRKGLRKLGEDAHQTIYAVRHSVKNPLNMDEKADLPKWEAWADKQGYPADFEKGMSNEQAFRAVEDALISEGNIPHYEGTEIMSSLVEALGHDGIVHTGGGRVKAGSPNHRVVIALHPEQTQIIDKMNVGDKPSLKGKIKELIDDERGSLGYRDEKPKLEDIPEEELTPQLRLAKALKQALPLREEQEALYTAERSKRFREARKVQNFTEGEEGYHAELSKLEGALPTVPSLASIRNQIAPHEIRDLFTQVAKHPQLNYSESLKARSGLAKLLGNTGVAIPTKQELELLSRVFPEAAEALGHRRSLSSLAADAINVPRSLMASADLSAALRQGLPLIHKKAYWGAFGSMFKQIRKAPFEAVRAEIRSRPSYPMMEDSGLALTDIGGSLANREEQFMSNMAEKIPVIGAIVKGSDRAYVGFLNKLRADTFDSIVNAAREGGEKLGPKELKDISAFINTATGRGDLNALVPKWLKGEEFDVNNASPLLSGTFFSPRLMASRVQMLNPMYYVGLKGPARKEALKSMMAYTTAVTTVLGLAKMAGLDVETDPRDTDFAKIKVGNTRYDVTAGFQPYVRTFAQLITGVKKSNGKTTDLTAGKFGQPTRADVVGSFLKNKEAPVVSFAHDLLTGRDRDFDKLDADHPENIGKDVGKMFVPLVAQDMYDLFQDQGAKGVAIGLGPSIFGVGVQTYSKRPSKGGKPKKTFDSNMKSGFKSGFGKGSF